MDHKFRSFASVDRDDFEQIAFAVRSQIEPEIILEIVDCHGVSHGVLDVLDTHTVFQCRRVDVHLGYRTTKLSVRAARFWEGRNTGNPEPTIGSSPGTWCGSLVGIGVGHPVDRNKPGDVVVAVVDLGVFKIHDPEHVGVGGSILM